MELNDLAYHLRGISKEAVDKNILFTPQNSKADLLFESIQMPHWSNFVTTNDLDTLYWCVTSKSLAADYDKRKKIIDSVMEARGFKWMAGGTNRNCYRCYEFPSIVAKVPLDRVGMSDNGAEYLNQRLLWPYCTKMLQVCPEGLIGFSERVDPIMNRIQFNAYAPMVYMTTIQLIGKYVLEDIGQSYFKNWGVRRGFGVCLLDYPYVFELDGNKLMCNSILPNGQPCFGEIDYDDGFDKLRCTRCGKKYDASELQLNIKEERIVKVSKGGKKPMRVALVKNGKILAGGYDSDSIVRPNPRVPENETRGNVIRARLVKGGVILSGVKNTAPATEPISEGNGNEKVTATVDLGCGVCVDPAPVTQVEEPKQEAPTVDDFIAQSVAEAYAHPDPNLEVNYEPPKPPKEEPKPVVERSIPVEQRQPNPEPVKEESKEEPVVEATPEPVKEVTTATPPEDFPKNQWNIQPQVGKKRRIITDSSSGDIVRVRQNDPYKEN